MKKTKKILIGILSVAFSLCMLGAVACGQKPATKINSVPQKVIYNVGTSIDLFDLFEISDGYAYTFKVGEKGKKSESVMGRYYYAEKSGDFIATLSGTKGNEKQSGSAEFTVSDTLPYMMISGSSIKMNYNSYVDIDRLINAVNMFISSDTEVAYSIDKVIFYKNHYVTQGEEFALESGVPVGDGFYDGYNRLRFNKEGVYDFHLLATNAGGMVDGNFSVTISENVSNYANLGEPSYNENTKIATWNAIDGASYYRVKIDYENVITDQTTIDINEYLIPEANGFQDFDLVIIPLDEDKKELKYADGLYSTSGMLIKEDVIIAPDGYGRIVLGETTKINAQTGVATLKGAAANVSLSTDGLMVMDSGYLGWQGDYGLNTYVEFEFTGNNIPNIIFFADEINNELTFGGSTEESEKNKGLMIISGIYGAYSSGTNMLACGDTVAMFGPNRYENGWSITDRRWCAKGTAGTSSYVPAPTYVGGGYLASIPSDYELLTQDGLKADTTGRTYKYVVGTYGVEASGKTKIFIEMRMYDVNNDDEPLFVVQQDTKLTTDRFDFDGTGFNGGNIIVIAASKEDGSLTEIKVSEPFTSQPLNVLKKNVTENADGSITLKGAYAPNRNSGSFRSDYESLGSLTGFRAYTGVNEAGYGLGSYMDITFKGNNMPMLTFFADETSGAIAEGVLDGKTGAGTLIMNGLVHKGDSADNYTDQLRIFGPYKYGAKNASGTYIYNQDSWVHTTKDYTKFTTSTQSEFSRLSALAQDNLDENVDYRLIIGAVEKDGYIAFDIQFVNVTENKLLVDNQYKTHVTVAEMKTALGLSAGDDLKGFIVVSGAFKGVDGNQTALDTTCKVTLTNTRPSSGLVIVRYPESVTLKGAYNNNRNSGNYHDANPTWLTGHKTLLDNSDKPASYGLNTYVDISFTGNNMPIMTFFATEDNAGIASGVNTSVTGAGILLLNGLVHKENTNLTNRFRITGPYKYGAKNSSGSYIYNQDNILKEGNYSISSTVTEFAALAALAQDNLVADNDYRLIVGAIEKDGYIAFDIQFKNLTTGTLLVNMEAKTTVTVEAMRTAMALGATDDLAGYIIFNGAYKGIDASSNPLSTTFIINAVQTGKITMPTEAAE